jgi:short-subunit dehydrogenase
MITLKRFQGQRALVTGASSGIGMWFARVLAEAGVHLVLVARRKEALETLAQDLHEQHGVNVVALAHDLSKPDAARTLVEDLDAHALEVDILINNAGVGLSGAFLENKPERESSMLRLNVNSVVELTRRLAPMMVARQRGAILFVASVVSFLPVPYFATYSATKVYIRHFAAALAEEMKDSGVTVTCLSPGATRTEFFDVAGQKTSKGMEKILMSPEAVARTGLVALDRGCRSVVAGFMNKLSVMLLKWFPTRLQVWLATKMMRNM